MLGVRSWCLCTGGSWRIAWRTRLRCYFALVRIGGHVLIARQRRRRRRLLCIVAFRARLFLAILQCFRVRHGAIFSCAKCQINALIYILKVQSYLDSFLLCLFIVVMMVIFCRRLHAIKVCIIFLFPCFNKLKTVSSFCAHAREREKTLI